MRQVKNVQPSATPHVVPRRCSHDGTSGGEDDLMGLGPLTLQLPSSDEVGQVVRLSRGPCQSDAAELTEVIAAVGPDRQKVLTAWRRARLPLHAASPSRC